MMMSSRKRQKQASQAIRAQQAAQQRRRRASFTVIVVVIVVLVAAGTGTAIWWTNRHTASASDYAVPTSASKSSPGLRVGDGRVKVDIYFDFMSNDSAEFLSLASSAISSFASGGDVELVYHPVDFDDKLSNGTKFSTRAAAAAGCAADESKLPDFISAVIAQQPKQGTSGLSNAELISAGKTAGITDSTFATCVNSQTYAVWVSHVSNEATGRGVSSTPGLYVNDQQVQASATELTNAVNNAL